MRLLVVCALLFAAALPCSADAFQGHLWCQAELIIDTGVVDRHGYEAVVEWTALALRRIGIVSGSNVSMSFRVARTRIVSRQSEVRLSKDHDLDVAATRFNVAMRNCMTIIISSEEYASLHGIANFAESGSLLCGRTQFAITYIPKRKARPWAVQWVNFVTAIQHEVLHVLGATHSCGGTMAPTISPQLDIHSCTREQIRAAQSQMLQYISSHGYHAFGSCYAQLTPPETDVRVPVQPVWLDLFSGQTEQSYTALSAICIHPDFLLFFLILAWMIFTTAAFAAPNGRTKYKTR